MGVHSSLARYVTRAVVLCEKKLGAGKVGAVLQCLTWVYPAFQVRAPLLASSRLKSKFASKHWCAACVVPAAECLTTAPARGGDGLLQARDRHQRLVRQ